jgi:hypothetical protein
MAPASVGNLGGVRHEYCLLLLTGSGRKLGTFKFDRIVDSEAISTAIDHEVDGPVNVWAECLDAAWLLYHSRSNAVLASHATSVGRSSPSRGRRTERFLECAGKGGLGVIANRVGNLSEGRAGVP